MDEERGTDEGSGLRISRACFTLVHFESWAIEISSRVNYLELPLICCEANQAIIAIIKSINI